MTPSQSSGSHSFQLRSGVDTADLLGLRIHSALKDRGSSHNEVLGLTFPAFWMQKIRVSLYTVLKAL